MPEIPTFGRRIAPDATALPRMNQAVAGQGAGALAEAGARTAQVFGDLARMSREAQQVTALTNAQTALTEDMGKLRGEIEMQADPTQIGPQWSGGTLAIQRRIEAAIQDPEVRARFGALAQRQFATDHLEIIRLEARRTREAGEAALDRQLQVAGTSAARDPASRPQYDADVTRAIAGAVASGIIPANKAEDMRQRYFGRLDQAEVMGLIARNPVQALTALADPARFAGLDPVARQRLSNTATSAMQARATAAEAGERRAERVQRLNADRAANDLWARVGAAQAGQGPMPTIADIQGQREWLSPGETRSLVAAVGQRGVPSDTPQVRVSLERQVDQMDPLSFQAEVGRAVDRGDLTTASASGLIAANRAARRDDAPPSPLLSGRQFVVTTLDPGNAPMSAFMRQQLAGQQAEGVAEYNRWAEQNPNAPRDEAIRAVRRISGAARESAAPAMRDALPLPYGFNGSRADVTQQTIAAAASAILRANLPPAEMAEQISRLEDWKQIITILPPAAPRPAAGAGTAPPPARGSGPPTSPNRRPQQQ